jgi:hypothetical protein
MFRKWIVFVLILKGIVSYAQLQTMPFSKVEIKSDTLTFSSQKDIVIVNKEPRMYFQYSSEDQVCEIRLYPEDPANLKDLKLLTSSDFELLDSMINFNNEYIHLRVKFTSLSSTDFLNFMFSYIPAGKVEPVLFTLPLLPYTHTVADLYTDDNQLFIGEEKTFELSSDHINNIKLSNLWTNDESVNYRITLENGHLYLHLISTSLGKQQSNIQLRTIKPFIDDHGELKYNLPVIKKSFTVKESRLRFLNSDLDELILDYGSREGYLIQLDNNPFFALQKTYRIEDQEIPGGPLVAELFTQSYLSNGRILCRIRPYSLHRKSQGYLYIKDNDVSRLIFNINIIPKTVIEKISLLREGGDWTSDLSVNPGENIQLKLEGQSLHSGQFAFEGIITAPADSLLSNDNTALFHLRIPFKISIKKINIFHDQVNTGWGLIVKEYQKPREFDYITVDINGFKRPLNQINSLYLASNVVQDVVFSFDPDKIDSEGKLYGVQILDITVTIRGKNNELIEIQNLENIRVCPGSFSPRAAFYDNKNCLTGNIELNRYLNKKTSDLDEWSKISIEIKNKRDAYDGQGYTKNLDIILERSWRFDIDVSFPAGLITFGGDNPGTLTGISMAMMAQFSFYEKNRINRLKPFKVGMGFLALDAFNFSNDSQNRDIALVMLGSLYPTRKESKLTFPLYFGGGYGFKNERFFFMFGPGIRVNL